MLAVLGPTASGKSALGLALAERYGGEIINCDSTAVYRGFDIGTDKPPLDSRRGIPHHLIDVAEPTEVYTAAHFARDAAAVIRQIHDRGRLPILVGGTGFYYRALTRGLFPGPGADDHLRARLDRVADRRGVERLHLMLQRADPESAARIMPRDRKRLVRALEVFLTTGRPLTAHFDQTVSLIADCEVIPVALRLPAAMTADRVAVRVDAQFARGIVEEVRGLLARGVPSTARSFGGLVYRQVMEMLHGVRDGPATRALISQENRRYARRQLIWFRKEPNLVWFDGPGERADTRARVEDTLAARGLRPRGDVADTRSPPVPPSVPPPTPSQRSTREPGAHVPPFTRVIALVLDSVGIGALPDAAAYGDEGSDTLGHIAARVPLRVPALRSLGLGRLAPLGGPPAPAIGAYGRLAEVSPGKDSVTGHWELMGIVLDRPFPTFPAGFPAPLITEFERRIGRGTIGNIVASGTEIIDRLGPEHVRTGKPIVYTSADSVFQIAAHEDVIPVAEQYRMCEVAFELAARGAGVGRVIARPFVGAPGAFTRTANRHDYALEPTGDTLLDWLTRGGVTVTAIGKIRDLFAGRGITRAVPTSSDADGALKLREAMAETAAGFIFVNFVDFDTLYGHRNNVAGYAANLERFDKHLGVVLAGLRDRDLLVVTADHGNDPSTPSTDHSREYVPVLLAGADVRPGVDLGTRASFADLGQTIAENFGVGPLAHGASFLEDIVVDHP